MSKTIHGRKDVRAKVFVLDTSVILYEHDAFLNFQEHDVALPIQVLEELDNLKSGNETRNLEARSFIRLLDQWSKKKQLHDWNPIAENKGCFRVVIDDFKGPDNAETLFGSGKIDHRILNCCLKLQAELPDKRIILVSKDICLRLKAKALSIQAEDYETGKIKNVDLLYSGHTTIKLDSEKSLHVLQKATVAPAELFDIQVQQHNHYYLLKYKRKQVLAFYEHVRHELHVIPTLSATGIQDRNAEQRFALHALLHPQIQLVTIQGQAGTGKTLLALAAAIEQRKNYRQIYITRPVVPLSNKEIGFLPGDAKSKVDPYMAPIWDNLRFIKEQQGNDQKAQTRIDELVDSEKIAISPLAFIRGRTLSKIFFIVDEAQNLTPHEVKTIISRAGENTKIVFTGDIYQIDTPYLDAESNGLSYLIDKAKDHPLYAHITLQKGERSELANLAISLL